jgi:hypothetical protein
MHRNATIATVLLAAAAGAPALTLDFGTEAPAPTICTADLAGAGALTACGNSAPMSQTYGDVAGVVDVSYVDVNAPPDSSLLWWDTAYNDLYGVVWASGNDAVSHARIELKATEPGASVTLTGLDLGAWAFNTLNTTLNIYAIGGGAPLYSYSGPVGNGNGPATHFALDVSAVGGLWIEWQDSAYNVGIDNVEFSIGAVPEPAPYALLLAGVAGMALRRRTAR